MLSHLRHQSCGRPRVPSRHPHSSSHRLVNALNLNGVDCEWLEPEAGKAYCPITNVSPDARIPVMGATLQRRGETARHDAVAWGFARAASARGVDIIHNCEVTGVNIVNGQVVGVETNRGPNSREEGRDRGGRQLNRAADMAGFRLPIQSFTSQALVSEPVKPVLDCVIMSAPMSM